VEKKSIGVREILIPRKKENKTKKKKKKKSIQLFDEGPRGEIKSRLVTELLVSGGQPAEQHLGLTVSPRPWPAPCFHSQIHY
jgi:hypothetical protein